MSYCKAALCWIYTNYNYWKCIVFILKPLTENCSVRVKYYKTWKEHFYNQGGNHKNNDDDCKVKTQIFWMVDKLMNFEELIRRGLQKLKFLNNCKSWNFLYKFDIWKFLIGCKIEHFCSWTNSAACLWCWWPAHLNNLRISWALWSGGSCLNACSCPVEGISGTHAWNSCLEPQAILALHAGNLFSTL